MAKSLSLNLILEKNKISQTSAWLILLEITLTDEENTKLYLVRNTEDIEFEDKTYTAFNFTLENTKMELKGQIPTLTLKISNQTRYLQNYLEELDGGINSVVKITVVNSEHLEENYDELTDTFDVIDTTVTDEFVNFKLGMPNPLAQRFPLNKYLAMHCNWRFKGVECGYAGGEKSCKRTYDSCLEKNNTARFGGYPGLASGNVRLV